MSEPIEYETAEEIRRLLAKDERFNGVSGATAFRRADTKAGWQDAGYFSFERGGYLYFVTVESAERPRRQPALIDNRIGPNFGKPMICRSCGRPRDASHTDCV